MTTVGRVLLMLTVGLGAFGLRPQAGEAQQRAKPRVAAPRLAEDADVPARASARLARPGGIPRVPAAAIAESEPNDDASSADAAALGDTLSGNMDVPGDLDWYVFNVASDTVLVLDVDANDLGSPMDPLLWLVAPDGSTVLAFNDDDVTYDSYIEFHVTTPGQYYAVVGEYSGSGGAGYFYYLRLAAAAPPPPGPGDPTTLFATDLSWPYGIAAGPAGEFYVTDRNGRLLKVGPVGAVSTLASFPGVQPMKVALDGLGDLLVTVLEDSGSRVDRVTLGGQVSSFATGFGALGAITVGPDGDVWVLDLWYHVLVRLDPVGVRKDAIDVSVANPNRYDADLAFSPGGILHFSNGYDAIYRIVNRAPELVISGDLYTESIAFDRDGYLYVAKAYEGRVLLYNPSYQLESDPFARSNLGGPIYLAFARAADGSMTSRLFATNVGYNLQAPYIGSMVEMRQAAMRAPGFRVGVDLLLIATTSLPTGIVGADYTATLTVTTPPGTPTWSVASGSLPAGLTLSSAGTIAGVPEAAGAFTFVARVDAGGRVGFRSLTLTVSQPSVSVADAASHLLAGTPLAPDLARFLDLQGNRNGRYDVGDFRAYLRSQGQLPSAAMAAGKEGP